MCYENEKDILNILRDGNRFIAKADRKSLSIIRWKLNKKPTHLELLSFLKENFFYFVALGSWNCERTFVYENSCMRRQTKLIR